MAPSPSDPTPLSGSVPPALPTRVGVGLIWARSRNGVIGADGGIPWRVPEDMAHFRATTTGSTVVMGRRTWESIPARFRPFADRRNVVLTRDAEFRAEGAETVRDLTEAIRPSRADVAPTDPTRGSGPDPAIWVVGGGQVYRDALRWADRVSETIVDLDVDGDTTAPGIGDEWLLRDDTGWRTSSAGVRYRILDWRR